MTLHCRGPRWSLGAAFCLALAACGGGEAPQTANPASVHCEQEGGQLEIRRDADGNEQGVCRFPDGSECDEWAFYRGECAPGDQPSFGER